MQTNFCDWINNYRIEYAKQIMSDSTQSHLSMQEISEISGFSTLSVFYRVFKEKTNISPAKYRKKILSDLYNNDTKRNTPK